MEFNSIFSRAPVNGTAARVVSQRGCSGDKPLGRAEVEFIAGRLLRKRRLLAMVLSIGSKRQSKNLRRSINKGIVPRRELEDSRALTEYRRVGVAIQRLQDELASLKEEHKVEYKAEVETRIAVAIAKAEVKEAKKESLRKIFVDVAEATLPPELFDKILEEARRVCNGA